MRRPIFSTLAFVAFSCGSLSAQEAQTAQEKADQDLRLAEQQLRTLQEEILKENSKLISEVGKLDNDVLNAEQKLRELLNKEDSAVGTQRQLNEELASRKGEFEYTLATLKTYGGSIKDRIHPAEKQTFGEALAQQKAKAEAATSNLATEIEARLEFLGLAADRLQQVTGGMRFDGEALADGDKVIKGGFAVAGPLGYFSSEDGSIAAFTAISPEGSKYPLTAPIKDGGEGVAALVKSGSATVPVDASMGKAIQVARTKKSLAEYLEGGGPVGYGIISLGLFALLVALWKVIEINRFPIPGRKKLNYLIDDLLEHRKEEAALKATEFSGLGGSMVQAGVEYFYDKRRILEDALLEKLGLIQPRLERMLPFLALVAAAAPMMGLLGTVLGIMKTFAMMSAGGAGDSKSFSAGISEALITTAMGLIVAIPVIIIHGMLKSLAKGKFGQAEGVALALLNGTTGLEEKPQDSPEDDGQDDFDETELSPA